MKYVADLLSFLRFLAIIPLIAAALVDNWAAAFWVLAIAWMTDLFDGRVAGTFGSLRERHPNLDADGIADSVLAFGSSAIAAIYIVTHSGWLISTMVIVLYVLTAVSGLWMVMIMNKPASSVNRRIIAFNMIVMHGIVQIAATLAWFTYMAFGANQMLGIVVGLLIVLPFTQRRKISLWLNGQLA